MEFKKSADLTGRISISKSVTQSLQDDLIIETPALAAYTRCGVIPYLTNDTIQKLECLPKIATIALSTLSKSSEVIKTSKSGVAEFTKLNEHFPITICTGNDQLMKPTNKTFKKLIVVVDRGGYTSMSEEEYIELQKIFKCTINQMDMVARPILQNEDTSPGLMRSSHASFRKNTQFHQSFIDKLKASSDDHGIVLAASPAGCKKTVEAIFQYESDNSCLSGITFFPPYSADPYELWTDDYISAISDAAACVPEGKLLSLLGPVDPVALCKLVLVGVTLFDTSYPTFVSDRGGALAFPVNLSEIENMTPVDKCFELKMNETKYCSQFQPMLDGCTCYACQNFTRAYVNHLLNTKEILAGILLTLHNLHHYMRFMDSIRLMLKDGTLKQYVNKLVRNFF